MLLFQTILFVLIKKSKEYFRWKNIWKLYSKLYKFSYV